MVCRTFKISKLVFRKEKNLITPFFFYRTSLTSPSCFPSGSSSSTPQKIPCANLTAPMYRRVPLLSPLTRTRSPTVNVELLEFSFVATCCIDNVGRGPTIPDGRKRNGKNDLRCSLVA